MLTSLAFIFLVGLAAAAICQQLKLPRIIGMLITGIILGPYVLDLLDPSILSISSELRQMALIIILLKAGLSLDLSDLKKVGRPAVLMSFVPASFEILAFFQYNPRWKCTSDGFCQHSGFHLVRHRTRWHYRVSAQFIFRDSTCTQALCPKQYESDYCIRNFFFVNGN